MAPFESPKAPPAKAITISRQCRGYGGRGTQESEHAIWEESDTVEGGDAYRRGDEAEGQVHDL